MLQPRTVERKRAKQGAKRAPRVGFQVQRRPAIRAIRARVEKGVDLLLEKVLLQGTEELFGLGQSQPEMLDALMVLVEGDDIGDGLFITLIITQDELQFDTHTGASTGSSDRGMSQAIVPELLYNPQHLPALGKTRKEHCCSWHRLPGKNPIWRRAGFLPCRRTYVGIGPDTHGMERRSLGRLRRL